MNLPFWIRHPKLAWRLAQTSDALIKEWSMTKSPWHSKTLWFNTLSFAAILLQMFGAVDLQLDADIQAAFITVGNFLLRLVTKKGLV